MTGIEVAKIDSLSPDPSNVRVHSRRNIEAIKQSLLRFGQQKPIVATAGGIVIAGAGTLLAAKEIGWSEIAVTRSGLAGADATAYSIADNRTADLAEWDHESLMRQLQEVQAFDPSLVESAGFSEEEINVLMEELSPVEGQENIKPFDRTKYEQSSIRQITILLLADQYADVLAAMSKYAEDHGLSNNTEVVLHIFEANGYAIHRRDASGA